MSVENMYYDLESDKFKHAFNNKVVAFVISGCFLENLS